MRFNEEDVRKFFRFFRHKKAAEIRVFDAEKYPQGKSVFVNNEEEFVEKCRYYCEEEEVSVYIGARDRKARKDINVTNSSFVLFEIDEHGENKTEERDRIVDFLKEKNIEVSMQGMSGGGWHFYIMHQSMDFATSEEALAYKESTLASFKKIMLSKGFDIDPAVFNLERVMRVLGTFNYKRGKISSIDFINKSVDVMKNTAALNELILSDPVGVVQKKNVIMDTASTDDCAFMNYCLMHEVPAGERHKIISRNMSLYLHKHPLKADLKVQYGRAQRGSEKELDTWLNSIDKNGTENYPFSCGELINFQKKYRIPLKCRGCPKFKKYLSEQKSEEQARKLNVIQDADYTELQKEVFTCLALKDRDEATELIVKRIEEDNFIYTTRDDVKSEMWIYDAGVYVPQGKSFVREFARKILEQAYTTQLSNAIISKIETDTQIEHDEFFNTNIVEEIPLKNGILNIKTRELTEHTPEKIFFNKLPVDYDESKDCPNVHKHFETILKDKESVAVMMEIFGYLLLKEYKIEKAFMFVGYGRNGKSKTIELMKRFIGAENCASVPLRSLHEESFSLSELFGRMANLAADLSRTDLKETGIIKSLIGRDTIQAKRKYLRDLNFVNYAKMVFAANELPRIYDTTDGFWTKWVLLEFPYKFVTQEVYDKEEKKDMLKIMDTDIMEKLTSDEELSGLLNFALDGLDRLMEIKDFSYSKSTADVKDMWIRKSDSFTAFCYDHIEEKDGGVISKKDLRKLYHKYTKKHKVGNCSDKAIYITLQNMFGADSSQNSSFDRVWDGIAIKNSEVLVKN